MVILTYSRNKPLYVLLFFDGVLEEMGICGLKTRMKLRRGDGGISLAVVVSHIHGQAAR